VSQGYVSHYNDSGVLYTYTPGEWDIFEGAVHGVRSYKQLEGRGTLYTSGSGRKLPYGYGGLDKSGESPYFEELFDVNHLQIRKSRIQDVIAREVEVLTGTMETG
jgi:hypothetical protein